MNSTIPYIKSPEELGIDVNATSGIYVMTETTWIDALKSTGKLQFGVGEVRGSSIKDRKKSLSSSKNLAWQKYFIDTIPNAGYQDFDLHKEIKQSFAVQLPNNLTNERGAEVFLVSVDEEYLKQFIKTSDFENIRQWLTVKIRKCAAKLNPDHEKQPVDLRNIQRDVIEKVIAALRRNGIVTNFVCELAARIGKTILFLELARKMNEEFGHKAMFIMAYGVGLSVKTSYKNECAKFQDFSKMSFIDAAEVDSKKQYNTAIKAGKMPIVFVSLNADAEEKYEWIHKLSGDYIALLEETDFGTHTDSQVEKVDYILENKTSTRINASGTNIGRLAKAFGKNAIDEIISVPYCMVEQDSSIPNVVLRRFYNMLFNGKINKLLEDFDGDLLPNITKILSKPYSQQKFISALFQDIFGYQPIYGFNISDCAGEEIKHTMLFANIGVDAMRELADVIEKACPEHKVLILNGDYTDNKEAEGLTKEELVRLQNDYYNGRNKLLVITNMMGTRSYSIPEIQACLFMQEGGDVYPYMQKYSRCLTPGFGKKFGHIFDFSFDQNKTRNSTMAVAVEATLLARQQGISYPDAVRKVMNSVNIKDMVSGQWVSADAIIKQFEDNNKLLEVANANTRISIEDLTTEEIESFAELAKNSSSTAEKTKIDKIVKTGKTFESTGNVARSKKNPLKAIVEKAIRSINGSATTVVAMTDYKGDKFLECLAIVNNNNALQQEFVELFGVGPETIMRLNHLLPIATLDMIVYNSKYNNTQKHVANSGLAILKDDYEVWKSILNRKARRFISSKRCSRILVVAGGHGTEIDVLVEMFGIDITKKIVYNDKYSCFCNQIKKNYPEVTIVQGNFLEIGFNMEFDAIVGNPPYTKNNEEESSVETSNTGIKKKDKNFYVKFIHKSNELLKVGGRFDFIIPNRFLSPSSHAAKAMKKWLQADYVMPDLNSHFNVATDIGAIGGVKVTKPTYPSIPYELPTKQVINRSWATPCPTVKPNASSITINDKVLNSPLPKMVKDDSTDAPYVFVQIAYKRYCPNKESGGPLHFVTSVNSTGGHKGNRVPFATDAEAELNAWFLSYSKLGRFLTYCYSSFTLISSSLIHQGFMPIIPVTDPTTNKPIAIGDDAAIYKLFDITDNEVKYIENTLINFANPTEYNDADEE